MGQYYTAILIDYETGDEKKFLPHDYENSAKLMEHSYVGNLFVENVCNELLENPIHLAWVGDYADVVATNEKFKNIPNIRRFLKIEKTRNIQGFKSKKYINAFILSSNYVILNHTKKEFIDMRIYENHNPQNIHPLPLLCAIGNGCGGGDYDGINKNLCGNWCGDEIECNSYNNVASILTDYIDITDKIKFDESRKKEIF